MDKSDSIEALPLAEKVKKSDEAKANYQFLSNEYVDAKDTMINWIVAYILKRDGDYASITFDGWPNKWDEV